MIKHEIRCDICNALVATIKSQLFDRVSVHRRYIKCEGRKLYNAEKYDTYVCENCFWVIQHLRKKEEREKMLTEAGFVKETSKFTDAETWTIREEQSK